MLDKLLKPVDYLLDRITMYRLLLYVLIFLLATAFCLSLLGHLQFSAFSIAFSAGYLTIICWLTNKIFATVFEAPVNIESVYITALILALIVNPLRTPHDILFLTVVAGLAIASKFILAIHKKHIFNPAAIAVVLTAFGANQAASWWVSSIYLLPFVIVCGLLVVRKIHRGYMVANFFSAVVISTVVANILTHHNAWTALHNTALHSPIYFLAFIMLVEPLTSPTTKNKQGLYGVLAGLLFPPQIHAFSVYATPELSLITANVFSYVISPKLKITPKLIDKVPIAPDALEFLFKPKRKVSYKAGQYMEWTLPHENPDSRGNRRYFTLASSPTEENIRLGVKFYPKGSSYKEAMFKMNRLTPIAAGHLGGDFVLPKDRSQKLVFIAGGIGITPFRSMIKFLIDTKDQRNVTLFYSEKNVGEFAFTDILNEATDKLQIKVLYTITDPLAVPTSWRGKTGFISNKMISHEVPNYKECIFYISGSHSMVTTMKDILQKLEVPSQHIKTDYFPGYA